MLKVLKVTWKITKVLAGITKISITLPDVVKFRKADKLWKTQTVKQQLPVFKIFQKTLKSWFSKMDECFWSLQFETKN